MHAGLFDIGNGTCSQPMTRPSQLDVLRDIARIVSWRSTCSRAQVGAVIHDARGVIVSTGYNGAPTGLPHCDHTIIDEPCRMAVHAEQNAILWAARRGVALEGLHLVCTLAPCYDCAKSIIQVGLTKVVYLQTYRSLDGLSLLESAGIETCEGDTECE